jgi:hypothetical protein
MTIDDLFKIGDDDLPYCNTEARFIKSIQDIYLRDKGEQVEKISKRGIVKAGRIKNSAVKELAFVYFKVNKKFFNTYSEDERDNLILKRLNLDNYVLTDELITIAVNELKSDVTLVEEKLINVIEENLHDQIELVKEVGISNKTALSFLKNTPINEQMGTALQERVNLLDSIKSNFNEMLRAIKDISLAVGELKKLRIDLQQAERKEGKVENRLEIDDKFYKKREINI